MPTIQQSWSVRRTPAVVTIKAPALGRATLAKRGVCTRKRIRKEANSAPRKVAVPLNGGVEVTAYIPGEQPAGALDRACRKWWSKDLPVFATRSFVRPGSTRLDCSRYGAKKES